MAGILRRLIAKTAVLSVGVISLGGAGLAASGVAADEATPPPQPPYARTGVVQEVGETFAVFHGFVNARGSTTTASFEYGPTTAYGNWEPIGEPERYFVGFRRSGFAAVPEGLSPGSTYHFRLVATSEAGTTYGEDETFRTLQRSLKPTIGRTHAYGMDESGAVLLGSIDPRGLQTAWYFQLGTTKAYGLPLARTSLEAPLGGDGSTAVEEAVDCLAPQTTYHFRLVARNKAGRTFGQDHSFRTKRLKFSRGSIYSDCPGQKPLK